jgi:hypothetical protein
MKTKLPSPRIPSLLAALVLSLALNANATLRYVNVNSTNANPPFFDWTTAATNIQDAIDVSVDGDQIFVTNGVYQAGGRVMAGDLLNRVALNKAITVQSVNGPWVTTIRGPGGTPGTAAVRCAWLTNGASLVGFNLQGGATRYAGDLTNLQSGGAVWCSSTNALVANCVIVSNTASQQAGGVYQGTVNNSLLISNAVLQHVGAAAFATTLNNCTVVSNTAIGDYAVFYCRLTNCIAYYNYYNYQVGCSFSYCCTTPAQGGPGNFTTPPQLFADGIHLTATSPCIGAGTNRTAGADIFGRAWANPPSIGCAEWDPAPAVMPPQLKLTSNPVGFTVGNAAITGKAPFTYYWLKDGTPLQDNGHFSSTQTTNLVAAGVLFSDAGGYQLVVSNASGMATSAVARLVIHCVDAAGTNPIPPYTAWAAAATNIQSAIDAAAAADVVLVTNGLYASGGKRIGSDQTNRITVDKAMLVQSVNGPCATIIQGAWDPNSGSGPAAVRCAWLTNNAVLSGFTLRGGATLSGTGYGGGVYGTFPSYNTLAATVANCVITGNRAYTAGGGAYQVSLVNCTVAGNSLDSLNGGGGGAYSCNLRNCLLTQNSCNLGSAANSGTLINCTVSGNTPAPGATAVYGATLTNCIVWGNISPGGVTSPNYFNCTLAYCCADPLATGPGNIDLDPQLLADGVHLSASSPCRGIGTNSVVTGTDIDGQPWANPPAIGCDEWQPAPAVSMPPVWQINVLAGGLVFNTVAAGQLPFAYFWTKDGLPIQDDAHYANSGTATLVMKNFGPGDAGLYQVVVSNAFGMATSPVGQVVIHAVDAAGANPVSPYSTWATAATNTQDAINAAVAGDIVLVTNGIYATGGKAMNGDLISRVALDKALTVTSVNGYSQTVIQGARDPVSTNGPGAVRCAWLTNGAVLSGFTLRDGATRTSGGSWDSYGGGAIGTPGSGRAFIWNCVLSNNCCYSYGGGLYSLSVWNSLITHNTSRWFGSGAAYAFLNNCTVVGNGPIAGTFSCSMTNCIVSDNYDDTSRFYLDNYFIGNFSYCCTYPLTPGPGNINAAVQDPQLMDAFHLAATSPCRGAGSALYATGLDLDGQPWANPPSMGCSEVVLSDFAGPLSVNCVAYQTNALVNHTAFFLENITGRASRVEWSFGDGPTVTNLGADASHAWTNPGDYVVGITAFNTDNPGGVSASLLFSVLPIPVPQLQSAMSAGTNFAFQFNGRWSANYTVQYATNLAPPVIWQTLQSLPNSLGQTYQITDPVGTNGGRFYRVLAQ